MTDFARFEENFRRVLAEHSMVDIVLMLDAIADEIERRGLTAREYFAEQIGARWLLLYPALFERRRQ